MDKPYKPIVGNPRRKTKQSHSSRSSSSSSKSRSTDERKRRVAVTPQDPEALDSIAEKFGLPRSKVYNMAFKALLEKLGRT